MQNNILEQARVTEQDYMVQLSYPKDHFRPV